VRRSAAEVADLFARGPTSEAQSRMRALADERSLAVRVIDRDGALLGSADSLASHGLNARFGDLFYGPDRERALAQFDAAQGAPDARALVRDAAAHGQSERCTHSTFGNLWICEAALRAPSGAVISAVSWSRRAFVGLYESRRQLIKLTLFVMVVGLGLSWWMGRRLVGPVVALREEVLARASAAVPQADIDLGRRDEVGDLASAFNALLAALQARTKANEELLADLAHELKNPVAAVRAGAERIEDAADVERRRRLARALGDSARRMDALVTQVLELAKAEAGLPREEREPLDLAALLRGLVEPMRSDEGPRIELDAPREPIAIAGVAQRLESAFRNLLDNACSFAGRGGTVRIALRADGRFAEASIEDSGPGIPDADLPRLFERFFTTRGDRQGTGLGLALTRAVVEAHGGHVRAESPAGRGARFVVRLPFTPDSSPIR
jgi:two-component system sensor histidine kinase ChvG